MSQFQLTRIALEYSTSVAKHLTHVSLKQLFTNDINNDIVCALSDVGGKSVYQLVVRNKIHVRLPQITRLFT